MKLYHTLKGIIVEHNREFFTHPSNDWDSVVNRDGLHGLLLSELPHMAPCINAAELMLEALLPPINKQEVWAAGVSYLKSREARVEESMTGGGSIFYDKVYDAKRPELFFKGSASRVAASGAHVHIRRDANWNVPEPELTLMITSNCKIVGYTCGNDMSARDIEGENPLYLPQAKVYDKCAGLGPGLYVPPKPIDAFSKIRMEILRVGVQVFFGETGIDQMKRGHQELADYLFLESSFPHGCLLMTGTGIVPPDGFSLAIRDEIRIGIDHIGTLVNYVKQKFD